MSDLQSILARVSIRTVLCVSVPAAIAGTRIAWRFFKQVNSEDWPAILGKCTFAGVTKKENVYELKVLYSYNLATGKFPTCGEFYKDFFNAEQANQWARLLQEMDIPIHHHPSDPEKSILWVSDLESIVMTRLLGSQGENIPPSPIVGH
jgi:hypothetical protein